MTFIFFLIACLNIKKVSAYYDVSSIFTQQSSISVSITLSGYDPCRFFEIRNQSLYRMGKSNVITTWNLSTLVNNQQNIYQTLDWSQKISNFAIGFQTAQAIATLKTNYPDIKYDFLDLQTLLKTQSYVSTASATYTTIKVIATKTHYLHLLSSNSSSNILKIYYKNMILAKQVTLLCSGWANMKISEDESSLIIWYSTGNYQFLYYIGSIWYEWSYDDSIAQNSGMNDVAMSKNGSVILLQYDSNQYFVVVNPQQLYYYSWKLFSNKIINQAIFLDEDCNFIALTVNYTTLQIYDTFTLTLISTTTFDAVSNYSIFDYSSGNLYLCLQQKIQIFKNRVRVRDKFCYRADIKIIYLLLFFF